MVFVVKEIVDLEIVVLGVADLVKNLLEISISVFYWDCPFYYLSLLGRLFLHYETAG